MRRLIICLPIALSIAARAPVRAQTQATSRRDSQTVVFVCEHGTVKSVLALAYFGQLARERHLPYRAISRGTAPDSAVPLFMQEDLRHVVRRPAISAGRKLARPRAIWPR